MAINLDKHEAKVAVSCKAFLAKRRGKVDAKALADFVEQQKTNWAIEIANHLGVSLDAAIGLRGDQQRVVFLPLDLWLRVRDVRFAMPFLGATEADVALYALRTFVIDTTVATARKEQL